MPQVMIRSKVFATREEAEDAMAKHYREYHPAGYGTSLRLNHTADGDIPIGWYYDGSRWDSCD